MFGLPKVQTPLFVVTLLLLLLVETSNSQVTANIFRPNTTTSSEAIPSPTITTTAPTTAAPIFTSVTVGNWTWTNVTSNSGFSVEPLGDFGPHKASINLYSNIHVMDGTVAYFRVTIVRVNDTGRDEIERQIWSYDPTKNNNNNSNALQFRCYTGKQDFISDTFVRLGDDADDTIYFKGGRYLYACGHNGSAAVAIFPAPRETGSVKRLVRFQNKLIFTGRRDVSDQSMSLYASNGTAEGTSVLFNETEVSDIYAYASGYPERIVGNLEPLLDGMPKLAFEIRDEKRLWVTDGTTEGTKPFLINNETASISGISDSFNGGKFLFRAGGNKTMVTNWENETYVLIDGFALWQTMKLNDTHMVFLEFASQGDASVWITDGTVENTHSFFTVNDPRGWLELSYYPADGLLAINQVDNSYEEDGPSTLILATYLTDGTTVGTAKVEEGSSTATYTPPDGRYSKGTYLPDGRVLQIPGEIYNNTGLLIVSDVLTREMKFIEDVQMPATNNSLSNFVAPIGNDTVLFFVADEEKGWLPWKINYPPLKTSGGSTLNTSTSAAGPTSSPLNLVPPPTSATTVTDITGSPPGSSIAEGDTPTSGTTRMLPWLTHFYFWASYVGLAMSDGLPAPFSWLDLIQIALYRFPLTVL